MHARQGGGAEGSDHIGGQLHIEEVSPNVDAAAGQKQKQTGNAAGFGGGVAGERGGGKGAAGQKKTAKAGGCGARGGEEGGGGGGKGDPLGFTKKKKGRK